MKQWRKVALIPALISALALTACASEPRPSVEEIKQAFHKSAGDTSGADPELLDSTFECMAKEVHESDLSDQTVNDLVKAAEEGESQVEYSSEDEKKLAEKVVTEGTEKCLSQTMGTN